MTNEYFWRAVCQELNEKYKVAKTNAPWLALYIKEHCYKEEQTTLTQAIDFITGEFDEKKLNGWAKVIKIEKEKDYSANYELIEWAKTLKRKLR